MVGRQVDNMREYVELRVREEYADLVFGKGEGKTLTAGGIRLIELSSSDPRIAAISRAYLDLKAKGESLFFGWNITRQYDSRELAAAELLRLKITATFAPSGDGYGTVYDESAGCPHLFATLKLDVAGVNAELPCTCGAGATQVSDLILDSSKLPKHADIASSFAHETVISDRLAQLFKDNSISGIRLRPVEDWKVTMKRTLGERQRVSRHDKIWHQLVITSNPVTVVGPTQFGNNPFDHDLKGEYRCPFGHVGGLAILSEVTVSRADWDGSDIFCTREFFGYTLSPRRPGPAILITPRLFEQMSKERMKGYTVEVAHFS
jgi:hypothetical protein